MARSTLTSKTSNQGLQRRRRQQVLLQQLFETTTTFTRQPTSINRQTDIKDAGKLNGNVARKTGLQRQARYKGENDPAKQDGGDTTPKRSRRRRTMQTTKGARRHTSQVRPKRDKGGANAVQHKGARQRQR
jgi:hypothetical protein